MRMNKQGKGGGNAVDEEEKRQMRAMGEGRAFDAPALSENVHASGKRHKAQTRT